MHNVGPTASTLVQHCTHVILVNILCLLGKPSIDPIEHGSLAYYTTTMLEQSLPGRIRTTDRQQPTSTVGFIYLRLLLRLFIPHGSGRVYGTVHMVQRIIVQKLFRTLARAVYFRTQKMLLHTAAAASS